MRPALVDGRAPASSPRAATERCTRARSAGKCARPRAARLFATANPLGFVNRKGHGQRSNGGHRNAASLTCLVLGIVGLAAAPAPAFALFGIHLWGAARGRGRDRGDRPPALHRRPCASPAATAALHRQLETASSLWTRPRDAGVGQRRAALQGPRRLPAAAGGALCRGLLRAGDQHPGRRAGGRRREPRRQLRRRRCRW